MNKFPLLILITLIASCNSPAEDSSSAQPQNVITSSVTYKKYEEAHKDYVSCKMERPQLTQDYIDGKMEQAEFATALERNNRSCNIKKEIFNKYYQLLEAEYDKAAEEYKIIEN
ncbi:hypothetical protein [Nonlabens xiamenensis]|uniref:hypothetical protein n=1 Tax=Nonlabens xiamenensis TaxID=2341043 RepID=UPI000F6048AB|nr:hypothetical protein [Nonlabens xiamenensis]